MSGALIPTEYAIAIAVLVLSTFVYGRRFLRSSQNETRSSSMSKGQRSKAMRAAFDKSETQRNGSLKHSTTSPSGPTMKVKELWVYPIKSLRGCKIPHASLTKEGFVHDRKFMLLKVGTGTGTDPAFTNMQISKFPSMCLFQPAIHADKLTITYSPPELGSASTELDVPLSPDLAGLKTVEVDMYGSRTKAYVVGEECNAWFSRCFGFEAVLVFWGGNPRLVLGNRPGRPAAEVPRPVSTPLNMIRRIPFLGPKLLQPDPVIAFNDCAPYLIITTPSIHDASARLPTGTTMDHTKFRANIVIADAPGAYDEDFWAALRFGADTHMQLTANCGRCTSLNVDYATGKPGTGSDGKILGLLARDRRVDEGMKYSPIFGRYGFVGREDEGRVVRVGDEVVVWRRNEERTRFFWPGLST